MERAVTTEKFEELYARLNPAQKQAVDTIEGPVMVVAGPGTGKTQVLTLRIANILRLTDTEPESILALTFTESAAISMRRRLAEIIGSPAYAAVISTFHGFCNDVIKSYPEEFPRIVGATHITEVDQIAVVEDILGTSSLPELKPFGDPFYYLRTIVRRTNELKREGVGAEQFRAIVAAEQEAFEALPGKKHESGPHAGKVKGEFQKLGRKIAQNRELSVVYTEYERRLAESRRYDYNDMVMEVLRTLERNHNLLLALQEQHQYILVDEHQDTNNAQNRIMELLASFHPNPNLFIVGDEKQAIFRFQGASLENFQYFKERYPEAKLVTLAENYRSNQTILDSAESLIRSHTPLRTVIGHSPERVKLFSFSRPEVETYFLATDIRSKLGAGVVPHDIAVLYRDNRDAFPVARMFEKIGIPFVIESDRDLLADADIKKLVAIFRAVDTFGLPETLVEALHIDFFGVPPLDIYKVLRYANDRRQSIFDVLRSKEALEAAGVEEAARILEVYRRFSGWATAARHQYFPDFFEWVVRESGFLAYLLAGDRAVESLDKLNAFFDEVRELIEKHREFRLRDFVNYLSLLETHGIFLRRSLGGYHTGRVRLMTAHKSKGLEFDYVYLVGVADGHWGNRRVPNRLPLIERAYALRGVDIGTADPVEDERRLFYVALTRAKRGVTISYARENAEGRAQLPCVFLEEIRSELLDRPDAERYEAAFSKKREVLFARPQVTGVNVKDREFIRELFVHHGLSVTALNNYLECPWQYFYTNLLRIPRAKTKHEMYGTAVHAALRDLFVQVKERPVSKELLVHAFRRHLTEQPLAHVDFSETLTRGTAALSGYYDRYHAEWRTNVITEFSIPDVTIAPDIRLIGRIDKLEFIGGGSEVNVVDYKTGKPKTRRELEGHASPVGRWVAGNEKRQLVFYNLLLDRYEEGRYRMVSGDIDFVQPDAKGAYHREHFVVAPEEVRELTGLIGSVAREILSLAFWDVRCERASCEFCSLREMMR